ncbi:MAG: AAA family ATPase [Erysipelotrichales bacterium]|nr:AAA family ATPase [Erysipelotrichales bacterium]
MNDLFIRGIRVRRDEISPDSYLRHIPAIAHLEEQTFRKPVTFFAGENGSGKSTLLEAIAIASGFNPEGGTRNYRFSTYDSHSELCAHLTVIKSGARPRWGYFLRAESFYNVATKEKEYREDRSLRLHEKSHGESFLLTAQANLKDHSLYFFDEPEAALSPQRQMTLLSEIYHCAKQGSQFFIATHSPILLGCPDAEILNFDDNLAPIEYEETDSYRITKMFTDNRAQILRYLLEEEE